MRKPSRRALGAFFIAGLPESIKRELILDEEFGKNLGYIPKLSLPLDKDLIVEEESLHDVLRKAISKQKTAVLTLTDGKRVKVSLGAKSPSTARIQLKERSYVFGDADLLARDVKTRSRALNRVLRRALLPRSFEARWKRISNARPFRGREFISLVTELQLTPEAIREAVEAPQTLTVEKLVPAQREYYETLMGAVGSATELTDYLNSTGAEYRHWLDKNRPIGFRRIGYAALAAGVVPHKRLSSVKPAEVERLLSAGDPFSFIFGFELCVKNLPRSRAFQALGTRFLKALLDDEATAGARATVFSACALMSVVGVQRAFAGKDLPLYWLRWTALTHAGVLADALRGLRKPESFLEWAKSNVGRDYVWYSVLDRREAPRWRPDWITPDKVEAELFGRIFNALSWLTEAKRPKAWMSVVTSALENGKNRKNRLPAFYAGPLDDFFARSVPNRAPALVEAEAKLSKAKTLSSVPEFGGLIYLEKPVDSVVEHIQRLVTSIGTSADSRTLNRLQMCADLAAIARSESLMSTVLDHCFAVLRTEKCAPGDCLEIASIMLTACAAHFEVSRYRAAVGDAMTRFAYAAPSERRYYVELLQFFDLLAQRDFRLMPFIARADAIVQASFLRTRSDKQ